MPVLIPIVVAVAAYAGSAVAVGAMVTAGIVAAGSIAATIAGVVVGAVIGAAVGAVGAAVTGGDIGQGALWGAVGGAVAGGFAGYNAAAGGGGGGGGSSIDNSSLHSMNGMSNSGTAANTAKDSTVSAAGSKLTDGMGSAAVQTGGQMVSSYAEGKAQQEAAEKAAAAAKEAQREEFDQRMRELMSSHESRMAEIGAQTDNSLALADKNNAAAMEQLNTRIGAENNAVATKTAREDELRTGFNESVMGTDAGLFDRPTFDFAQEQQQASFNSGFSQNQPQPEQAVAQSNTLTPEEEEELLAQARLA